MGGINLMTVDGGTMDSIIIQNIWLDSCGAPIFIKLGNRDNTLPNHRASSGSMSNITIDSVYCAKSLTQYGSQILGMSGTKIKNVVLKRLNLDNKGTWSGASPMPNWLTNNYPEYDRTDANNTKTTAWGLNVRHVDGLTMENCNFLFASAADDRPCFLIDSCSNVNIDSVKTVKCKKNGASAAIMRNGPTDPGKTFVTVDLGNGTSKIFTRGDPVGTGHPQSTAPIARAPALSLENQGNTIVIRVASNWEVALTDLSGITVFRFRGFGPQKVALPDLGQGCFIARLKAEGITESIRFMHPRGSYLKRRNGTMEMLSKTEIVTRKSAMERAAFVRCASGLAGVLCAVAICTIPLNPLQANAAESTGYFAPIDKPNTPIGTPRGIIPGRVVWARDSTAISYPGTGDWTQDSYNNQKAIDTLLFQAVTGTTGKNTAATAWDALFKDLNKRKTGAATGYNAPESIAIKINLNNNGSTTQIDASPHLLRSLLRELVNDVHVPQASIFMYDAARVSGFGQITRVCKGEFPNVNYGVTGGIDTAAPMKFSGGIIDCPDQAYVCKVASKAKYYINCAILKRHCEPTDNWSTTNGNAPVSMCFKTHIGEFSNPWAGCGGVNGFLHAALREWQKPMGSYCDLVDLESNPKLGGKTVLYILDGLLTGNRYDSPPVKWKMFGGKYPCSVFASQDPVALESVGIDFFNANWAAYGDTLTRLIKNADNHLHEGALLANPPSGTNYVYKDEWSWNNGSLGVHEHWNNATEKKYTKIDFLKILKDQPGVALNPGSPLKPLEQSCSVGRVNGRLFVAFRGEQVRSLEVVDCAGRSVWCEKTLDGESATIDTRGIKGGEYFLLVNGQLRTKGVTIY
jgi:hypothetical protein